MKHKKTYYRIKARTNSKFKKVYYIEFTKGRISKLFGNWYLLVRREFKTEELAERRIERHLEDLK